MSRRVATITLNPAYDLVGFCPEIERGEVNLVRTTGLHAAGKGINVAKVLKDLGIDVEKKLVVQDMSSDLFKRKDVSTSKTYQLEVNSATQLAHVFQALQAVGISDASIERTDVSNMDELRQQVRAAAAKAAQQNAQVLASALGQKAGKALFVQDYSYSARPYANIMMAKSAVMDMAAEATAAPTLEFEKIKIEHSVMVRFVLE